MPRVLVLNGSDEVLLVHHNQDHGRDQFWVLPGGDVEPGENSLAAAVREVREETGVAVRIVRLLWLVEEIDAAGRLRSHPYFLGEPLGGVARPGSYPDRPPDAQVIDDAGWFTRERIAGLDRVYPEILRAEFWRLLDGGHIRDGPEPNPAYRSDPPRASADRTAMDGTRHTLVVADSRRLDTLADGSVHLVLTSPPYPMIEMWDGVFDALDPEVGRALDDDRPRDAWELMHRSLDTVWDHVARVLAPGGFAAVNVGDATRKVGGRFRLYTNHARVLAALEARGLDSLPPILWRKQTNAPNKFMGSGMLPGAYVTLEHEHVLVHRKGGPRVFGRQDGDRRRRSAFFWEERNQWFSDLWDLKGARQPLAPARTARATRTRSAAFPFELAYRLVAMYSVQGDTVLDPFVGTGTTTVAAAALGRSSVGVDHDAALVRSAAAGLLDSAERLNTWTRDRLARHHAFVKDAAAAGRSLAYQNTAHAFPVMTAQERELALDLVDEIRLVEPLSFAVSYRSP